MRVTTEAIGVLVRRVCFCVGVNGAACVPAIFNRSIFSRSSSHWHTHTHTRPLSLAFSLSLFLSLTRSLTHLLTHSLALSLSLSLTHSLSHPCGSRAQVAELEMTTGAAEKALREHGGDLVATLRALVA